MQSISTCLMILILFVLGMSHTKVLCSCCLLAKLQWCLALLFIPRFITSTSRTSWFFFHLLYQSFSCTLNSNVFECFLYQISSPIISTCKFITSSTIINVLTKYISFQVQVLWLYQKQPGRWKIDTPFN